MKKLLLSFSLLLLCAVGLSIAGDSPALPKYSSGNENQVRGVLGIQYSGTPSSYAILTADGTVFTLAAGEIGFIQNLDDAPLAVKKGASASPTSLSFILAAGSAADDGKGGNVQINDWVGVVSVAAMTGTARYVAWKQAP